MNTLESKLQNTNFYNSSHLKSLKQAMHSVGYNCIVGYINRNFIYRNAVIPKILQKILKQFFHFQACCYPQYWFVKN